jgi:hypothetical protein
MNPDLSSIVLHPKANPAQYFNRFQNPLGEDTIFVYYRDYIKDGNDFNELGPIRYDRKIEVKTNLSLGMLPGFYLRYFDYALEVDGNSKGLQHAYHDQHQMEFGIFDGVNLPGLRDPKDIPLHWFLWSA